MKKIFTFFFAVGILFNANLVNAQSFSVAHDSITLTAPTVATSVHDDITVPGLFPATIKWYVCSTDFPGDWINNGLLASTAFCDNSGCYPTTDDTNLHVLTSSYSSGTSDFHMQINLAGVTSTGTHSIKVKFMSNVDTLYETFVVSNSLTVPTVKSADEVILYPNPATSTVNVVFDASIDVKNVAIYNIIGKMMSIYKVNGNSASLNVDNFNSGIYIIRLMNSQGDVVLTRKFTKQ